MTQAEQIVKMVIKWQKAGHKKRVRIEEQLRQLGFVLQKHGDKVFVREIEDADRTQDAAASRGS